MARSSAPRGGLGKSTGATLESAKEPRTKSAWRKRTCWYATRRGQKTAKSEAEKDAGIFGDEDWVWFHRIKL